MTKRSKLITKILSGTADHNIDFIDLIKLMKILEFECRIKGSHHIFYKIQVDEIINIQPLQNNKAKPYQVKQIRNLILKYNLNTENNELQV
jgi:hypothetical protein